MKHLFAIFTDSTLSFQGKEADENVILVLRRHIFTLVPTGAFLLLCALVPILVRAAFGTEITARSWGAAFLFAASIWYAFLWLAAFYTLAMYALNTVIVTDRRIIENEQKGFFDRKVSELHLNRVQDVSSEMNGFFETMFSFGNVMVQTAASEREFVFRRIGRPEAVKDAIMKAAAVHNSVSLS